MVKQQRRADRCFVPAAGNSVTWVRFPVSTTHRRSTPHSSSTTEEERGDAAADGGSGETKRARLDGSDEAAAPSSRESDPGSGGQPGSDGSSTAASEQQGAAESTEDSRAAELQPPRSLQVTIQQRSESRAFRQTDRSDRQTGPRCHVCDVSCCSLQAFQEHMVGSEHLRKLKEMTHCISLNTHTLQQRGRVPDVRRWCDICQTHFNGDVIIHRRTKQHKVCKQLSRPFCPVCKRHFRTPRKFVEHMKSAEHKEQVQLEEAQEEELITVDAVGCFQEEQEQEEEEEEQQQQEEEEDKQQQQEEEQQEEQEEEDEQQQQEEEQEEEDEQQQQEEEQEEEDEQQQQEEEQEEEDEQQQVEEQQEEQEQEQEVDVAEEEEEEGGGGGAGAEEEVKSDVQVADHYDPLTIYGSSFILPVSGFVCRLCNKFFYKETTARHTHCRTHTHYVRLQREHEDAPVSHDAPVCPGD